MFKKILTFILFLSFLSGCVPSPAVSSATLRVYDGMTGRPVPYAEVVVPETGDRFITDEHGRTEKMSLPVIPDAEYDGLCPNPEGRITFIVFAEGYTPYLLLYARTGKDRVIDVLLFPDDGTLPVFTVIEAPSQEWAAELIGRFR